MNNDRTGRKRAINAAAFEADQRRTVEDLYDIIGEMERIISKLEKRIRELEDA